MVLIVLALLPAFSHTCIHINPHQLYYHNDSNYKYGVDSNDNVHILKAKY